MEFWGAHFHSEGFRVLARQVRGKVEYAGKLLRIKRSRKQRDSNESWNWLVKSSIQGALLPVLKNTIVAIFLTQLTAHVFPRMLAYSQ